MPTLVLMRHAHASPGSDDRARRLDPRGREEAASVRRWLLAERLSPDRVLVSEAARTQQTWELASVGSVAAVVDERLYEASVEDLRGVVASTAPSVATLVLVCHNPAVERLAWELDDRPAARELTDRGMGPGCVAVVFLDGWDSLHGRLIGFEG
ncbi:MAG TPA: histidine phosphatase family protein [Mycobacteriales bacterium]|nr:histidine phosphatase family protein [Mycobacteriales bacterium]